MRMNANQKTSQIGQKKHLSCQYFILANAILSVNILQWIMLALQSISAGEICKILTKREKVLCAVVPYLHLKAKLFYLN